MSRPKHCDCDACCHCFALDVEAWDADDWDVMWVNPDTPQGTESVTFNGTSLVIRVDSNAHDDPEQRRKLRLIHKRLQVAFTDSRCPWRWGIDSQMRCSEHVDQPFCKVYRPTFSGILWDDRTDSVPVTSSNFNSFFHDETWHWKIHNLAETPQYPALPYLCRAGFEFDFAAQSFLTSQSLSLGTYEWRFGAPTLLRFGSCIMPKHDYDNGQISTWTALGGLGVLGNGNCYWCAGDYVYIPTSPPVGWQGPSTKNHKLYAGVQSAINAWSDGSETVNYILGGYATFDRPRPFDPSIPVLGSVGPTGVVPYCRAGFLGSCSGGGFTETGDPYTWCNGFLDFNGAASFSGQILCFLENQPYYGSASQLANIQSGSTIALSKTSRGMPECYCEMPDTISLTIP